MTTTTQTITDVSIELRHAREAIELLGGNVVAAPGKFSRLFTPDVRHYGPGRDFCTATALVQDQPETFAGFSDRSIVIHDLTQSGDRVLANVTFSGQHTADFRGCTASGERQTADALVVLRFEDGQIAVASSVLRWR